MKIDKNYLKKRIIYKLTYSGTKESDLIYKIMILNKIADFSLKHLKLIDDLLKQYSDNEILKMLLGKKKADKKYEILIKKIRIKYKYI
tara:strand:+ start:12332 stop:12595 length:264 start_codon:yes stop_codon:yes gene_type:complete